MPDTPTPRLGLPRPSESDPADPPTDFGKLTDTLDPIAVVFLQGPSSSLPPAGVAGRMFFATDARVVLYDDGQSWNQPGYSPGDLKVSAAALTPAGWLACDGSAIARVTYPALYAVIGVSWGAGDGSSTFNVPDLRGRSPIGAGQGTGLSARAVGARGGEELHVLTPAELAAHSHGGATGTDTPDHAHTTNAYTGTETADHTHSGTTDWQDPLSAQGVQAAAIAGQSIFTATGQAGSNANPKPASNGGNWGGVTVGHQHGFGTGGRSAAHQHLLNAASGGASARHAHAIGADGGGGGHNNMGPFAVVTWLVKT